MNTFKHRLFYCYQRLRILKYRFLSDCPNVNGFPRRRQPVQLVGRGKIHFKGRVDLGVYPSPFFLNGYIYIEARTPDSVIEFGDGVWINNNTYIISEGSGIFIGNKTLIGVNCQILDSDFHDTHPERRMNGRSKTGKVIIGENVMIGSNVTILKGVRIGENSIVANGAVVTKSIPENSVVYGNPGRHCRQIVLSEWVISDEKSVRTEKSTGTPQTAFANDQTS